MTGHKTLFAEMAHKISAAWAKYNGPLSYPKFVKKMWKENKPKKAKKAKGTKKAKGAKKTKSHKKKE